MSGQMFCCSYTADDTRSLAHLMTTGGTPQAPDNCRRKRAMAGTLVYRGCIEGPLYNSSSSRVGQSSSSFFFLLSHNFSSSHSLTLTLTLVVVSSLNSTSTLFYNQHHPSHVFILVSAHHKHHPLRLRHRSDRRALLRFPPAGTHLRQQPTQVGCVVPGWHCRLARRSE